MKPLFWMIAVAIVSWLAITAVAGAANPEAGLGMFGPLLAAGVTWVLVRRTYALSPERLTSVMIAALAAKMVFFGVYVIVMVRVLALRPIPFMASFTGYFVALYVMEALFLRRLFADGMRMSR
ncbi:MAG: hypothetical protein ABL993_09175 [Vicinamibacterales bacterium]